MQISRLKNNFASIVAFGHMNGLGRSRHKFVPAVPKPILIDKASMTAQDMGVTFESCPELYRAINPIFNGRTNPDLER